MPSSALVYHRRDALSVLTPIFVGFALLFGGATHGEALSSGFVRLFSLALLGLALMRLNDSGLPEGSRWPVLVLAGAVLVPLLQLIPLPPALWIALPGREPVAEAFRAANVGLPWMPLSLSPAGTVDAFLSLAPPAATFLAVISLGERARRRLTLIVVAAAVVATMLGLAQVASGEDSSLRAYAVTNIDSAVGFFANRNHHAVLMVVALPLIAYWIAHVRANSHEQKVVYRLVAAGLLVILFVSLAVTRSRAGVVLGVAAIAASALILWFSAAAPRIAPLLILAVLIVGGGLVLAFALEPLLARFQDPVSQEARVTILPGLLAAAKAYSPFGSGLGAFVPVYQMFERPETVMDQFVNHAHNDYLELWIETGVVGAVVLAAGVAWCLTAAFAAAFSSRQRDPDLARVAALVVLILLVHSGVDYPLRTAALSVVFALACALLVPPPRNESGSARRRHSAPANDGVKDGEVGRLPHRPSVTTRRRRA